VADPTEDVPTNDPPGQGDSGLGLGVLGPTVPGTAWVGAAVEFANQLKRTVQSENAAIAVIANMHHPSAAGTVTVNNVQLLEREVRIFRPAVRHGVDFRVSEAARSSP